MKGKQQGFVNTAHTALPHQAPCVAQARAQGKDYSATNVGHKGDQQDT